MRVKVLNRVVVALGISAVALVGLTGASSLQPAQDRQRQEDQRESKQQAKKRAQRAQEKQQLQAQKEHEQEQARQQRQQQQQGRVALQRQRPRLAPQDQQELIHQQQQRLAQYREHLVQQQRLAQPQSARLRQQNRMAQHAYQQQYVERLRQQQLRILSPDRYNYGADPYFYTPPSYRYSWGGRYYETNQYGADLLRQAVSFGYEEGWRAGMADRQDRWASNYKDSYAYQDANYGYAGFYVDRDEYNIYFREGFRRGYDDGFSRGNRYGRYTDGRRTILSDVLTAILNFEPIR